MINGRYADYRILPDMTSVGGWIEVSVPFCGTPYSPTADFVITCPKFQNEDEIGDAEYTIAIDNLTALSTPTKCPTGVKDCNYCSSFKLIPGEKYVMSGWARMANVDTSGETETYLPVNSDLFTYEGLALA
ncbi:hypothetical protein [Flavobacterium sp. 3HN19-14]|uniref:hypothetical protein n=1 Tax=Flavobacterium sp. 3HN19-14 TaxID=3448133 RepID=UPI003EE0CA16